MNPLVRLTCIELCNFKNVQHGEIKFSNYQSVETKGNIQRSDILGIYGQNGSGKTAIVEALDISKILISGKSIPFQDYSGLINTNKETSIKLTFFIHNENDRFKVEYRVCLGLTDSLISIPFEQITYWTRGKTWKSEKMVSINNPYYGTGSVTAGVQASLDIKGDSFRELEFISSPDKLAVLCAAHGQSFFFNNSVLNLFSEKISKEDDFQKIVTSLSTYAKTNYFVIKVGQLAHINSQTILPLNVRDEGEGYEVYGCIPLFLNGNGLVPQPFFEKLTYIIDSVNIALSAVIPNLKFEFEKIGEETDSKGAIWYKIDMFSVRNEKRFSTKYESEGIKRIISLMSCLVSVFNNPETSLVVDEFDSGIFEYLLGEILSSFEHESKGQLIFTSHNLRAFEKLPNESIVCSTTNPANRYVRLTGINKNNNKRDFYIRALVLGGQKEILYDGEELDNIGYAFRKAGKKG